MFAIKAINKRGTVHCEIVERLICEQGILEMSTNACHPFLVNMFTSFQTQLHACFVMEYAARGGLLTHSKGRSFTEPRAMSYSSSSNQNMGEKMFHLNLKNMRKEKALKRAAMPLTDIPKDDIV
ncbi:hypothetical protein AAFF_G00426520 [Aldrovandia affinis]|uniref:non-specific serine/threonine protein kinase n=1 Tax=Aldrovandia affinis TaxID=143900 RepID=A0AAD7WIP5_9TELE|nr:hypothetical protein AAFF_G00426520 [Aldrovandia affinis]